MEPKSKPWAAASGSRRTEAARRIGRGEDFLERSGRGDAAANKIKPGFVARSNPTKVSAVIASLNKIFG